MSEQVQGVTFTMPSDAQKVRGLAVYIPGFGDVDGPFGAALTKALVEDGIAVASVSSAQNVDQGLHRALPFSEQFEQTLMAIEGYNEKSVLPTHLISMSQGSIAANRAAMSLADDGYSRTGGLTINIAPPLTGPLDRLSAKLLTPEAAKISSTFALGALRGVVQGGSGYILIDNNYWHEVEGAEPWGEVDPWPDLEEIYRDPSGRVILAGNDEVLGDEQAELLERLRAIDPGRVAIVEGASHEFSNSYRRKAVTLVLGYLAGISPEPRSE